MLNDKEIKQLKGPDKEKVGQLADQIKEGVELACFCSTDQELIPFLKSMVHILKSSVKKIGDIFAVDSFLLKIQKPAASDDVNNYVNACNALSSCLKQLSTDDISPTDSQALMVEWCERKDAMLKLLDPQKAPHKVGIHDAYLKRYNDVKTALDEVDELVEHCLQGKVNAEAFVQVGVCIEILHKVTLLETLVGIETTFDSKAFHSALTECKRLTSVMKDTGKELRYGLGVLEGGIKAAYHMGLALGGKPYEDEEALNNDLVNMNCITGVAQFLQAFGPEKRQQQVQRLSKFFEIMESSKAVEIPVGLEDQAVKFMDKLNEICNRELTCSTKSLPVSMRRLSVTFQVRLKFPT